MNNPQGKRLIPEYLLKYLRGVKENGLNITELVDSKGNPRFIEGDITTNAITGLTFTYAKWSLSGSHLMIVLAGTIENGATIAAQGIGVLKDVPSWVKSKIYPVWAGNYIELKNTSAYNTDWSTQNFNSVLVKDSVNDIRINITSSFTATKERNFRIQFDLLIDTE